jgi:hypothetical protein
MTLTEYRLYKRNLNFGKLKGIPTPNLAFAFKDLSENLTVHRVFGFKVIALDPKHPQKVVDIMGITTGNPHCQLITNFDFKAYSNRVYRRNEPFFQKFLIEAKQTLSSDAAILISIVPANTDAYFRYKILEVIKRNDINTDDVKTAIACFYKTSFNAMIMVIKELEMKNGNFVTVKDFEIEKIKGN